MIGTEKGRRQKVKRSPSSMRPEPEAALLATVFQSAQQVRSVKVFQIVLRSPLMRTDSSMIM